MTILAALICGYATLCLLFYQGQWQLVLHPVKTASAPSIAGTSCEPVRFGVDESGEPQLTGCWIAAGSGGKYTADTMLFLPSGDGSLADAASTLSALHTLGINILAFDYRGYGQSAPVRPDQARMSADAESAWTYLTVSRKVPANTIILFGMGVGGALAAEQAVRHAEAPAVIFLRPEPGLLSAVLADPRTRMLPVRALFHDRFDVAATVRGLKTPKLFLVAEDKLSDRSSGQAEMRRLLESASDPKVVSILKREEGSGAVLLEQIRRFLDLYLH